MVYAIALQAPNRQQWEPSSQFSQSWNCGPSCVSFIAGFYTDSRPAIEYNRRMIAGMGPYNGVASAPVYGSPPRTPTNAWQQRDMLEKRRVPSAVVGLESVAQLHGLVDNGRHPVIIGIEMSRVPGVVRGHSFTGWHAVVIISGATVGGARGFWVMDPNFAAGSPASRRFYSNTVMQSAWANNTPRWGVVPDRSKPTAAPPSQHVKFNDGVNGVNIRRGPTSLNDNVYAVAWTNTIRRGTSPKGKYIGLTSRRRDLHATVKGDDGQFYYRISLPGVTASMYVNTRFMHRV